MFGAPFGIIGSQTAKKKLFFWGGVIGNLMGLHLMAFCILQTFIKKQWISHHNKWDTKYFT